MQDQLAVDGRAGRRLQIQPDRGFPFGDRQFAAQQPVGGPGGRPHQPGCHPIPSARPGPDGLDQAGQRLGLQVMGQPRIGAAQRVDTAAHPRH
jgi:hypothetical protein